MRSSRRCSVVFVASVACAAPSRTARALDLSGEADYGAPAAAAAPDEAPLVRLALIDLHGLLPDVGAGASAEAATLLDRLGARIQVQSKQPSEAHDPRDVLVVVMPGQPGPLLDRSVLGSIQRDAPTRALWVFPRTIAAAVGLAPDPAAWTPAGRARFATALGRVMAHEIVHLTCPWRDHDRTGLMAARMSRGTLRGEALLLADELRRDFVLGAAAQSGWAAAHRGTLADGK
ncbi:MAG: hypothetical protein ABW221_14780 [Vicinamibacteria bacterium]